MSSDFEILREASRLLQEGRSIAFCTVIEKKGHGPRDVGAKMIIREDGKSFGTIGGGVLERVLIEECLKTIKERKSKKVTFNLSKDTQVGAIETGMICGGELTMIVDIMEPTPRLVIVGAGHVASPLAQLASIVGFKIIIVDDERKLVTKDNFPMAEELIAGDYEEVLGGLDLSFRDFVVVAHGEPEHDYTALKKLLEKAPVYVGLLASSKKAVILTQRLKAEGISEVQLLKLHTPVGLNIGAETPEEIALSILAEIIQLKSQKKS